MRFLALAALLTLVPQDEKKNPLDPINDPGQQPAEGTTSFVEK